MEPVLRERLTHYPVVTLLGPRRAGKATLARAVLPGFSYANLEDPETRDFAHNDPKGFFKSYGLPLIIDEIQRVPTLLSYLQVFADEHKSNGLFILTGSNQPALSATVSQSLAGRTSILTLLPLSIEELSLHGVELDRDDALVKGFLPRVHAENQPAYQAYQDYLASYIERDVRQLINVKDLSRFRVFLRLLAGRVGQILNLHSMSADCGVSSTTLAQWLSVLEASFITFRCEPYFANLGKRLTKSPKVYFYEPGVVSALLQIETAAQAERDPLLGSLFENMAMVELMKAKLHRGSHEQMSFYRDSSGLEVDALIERRRRLKVAEVKASRTFHTDFLKNLRKLKEIVPDVDEIAVVYGGDERFEGDGYRVLSWREAGRLVSEG